MSLILRNLRKTFPAPNGRLAGVHELDLEIPEGEGFSLLGPSGCGKTTALRLIGGFERPEHGQLLHRGADITQLPPHQRDIRTVFQRYALFPHLTVFENVVFSLRVAGRPEAEIRSKAKRISELIEIAPLLERPIARLSGGEQQRVALARALISEPSILLLDEPLSALDLKLRERMQSELLALRRRVGSTFLFVTHDQTEAMFLSDRIGILRDGRLEQVGTPEEIYRRPRTRFVASFIGLANFVPGTPELLVRPENTLVFKTRPLDGPALSARIHEASYLGHQRLLRLRVDNGSEWLAVLPGDAALPAAIGEEVWLSWKPEAAWPIPLN